jgi:hypothetical protein
MIHMTKTTPGPASLWMLRDAAIHLIFDRVDSLRLQGCISSCTLALQNASQSELEVAADVWLEIGCALCNTKRESTIFILKVQYLIL